MTKRKKITIVGAGKTGAETALMLAIKGLGDIVLLDIPENESQTKGKALDLLQATSLVGTDVYIKGTASYEDTTNSDLVIITAGIARKPGMSRTDLIDINLNIVADAVNEVVKYSPETVLLILTNPVDIMTYVAYKVSGFPKNRVIGQAGILDTARFRTFIAEELDVSIKDVTAFVLGVHGDEMVPLPRYSFVNGIPLEELLPKARIEALIERTRRGGAEIVNLLGNGSAAYAPAASLAQMAECILLDQQRLVPAITYLEGEYGYNNLVFGVPVILGANGIERIIQINLLPAEREALDQSVRAVKEGIDKAYKMGSRKLA